MPLPSRVSPFDGDTVRLWVTGYGDGDFGGIGYDLELEGDR